MMSGSFFRKVAVLGALACAAAGAAKAEPLDIDDLTRLPMLSDISLSADGRYLTALVAADGAASEKPALSVWRLDDPDAAPVITKPGSDVEFIGASALNAGKVLAVARKPYNGETFGCDGDGTSGYTRAYTYKLLFTDEKLKKFEDPFAIGGVLRGRGENTQRCLEIAVRGSVRSDLLTLDPENIVISEFDARSFKLEYKKYNLRTGETKFLFNDAGDLSVGYIDPRDASIWTKSDVDYENGEYSFKTLIRDAETGDFNEHDALTWNSRQRNTVDIVGRDEATGKFYVLTDRFSDKAAVYMYDPQARAFDETPAFAHREFEASGVILGHAKSDFNQLLGFTYEAEETRDYWLDPFFKSVEAAFGKLLPDRNIRIIDYSDDRSRIVVRAEASNAPPSYYLLEGGSKIRKLGDAAPWLDTSGLSKTELVHYLAPDGLTIPAFLTPPASWKKGDAPAPAIVLPHGGPWARDYAGWDPTGWAPFFTSRGYAVLQPQYRGSTGWGRALWLAGDGQWGLKMQDDKDAGARWLASEGYADPERIAIFGYSYGGFAALAASVREGGPFRCAIAGAGVSDLTRLGRAWSDNRLQRYLQGKTVKGFNPMDNIDKLSMPILIIHGDRDVRVPISHSRVFYNKIEDKSKAEFVEIKDMPHSLPWTPAQQREMLSAIDGFLTSHCGM